MEVAAAGSMDPMHPEPSSQSADSQVETGLRDALSEMEHLRAANQSLRSDKAVQQDAHTRLEAENMELWDQVRDCRRSIDTLSQQLKMMQEAMQTSGKSATSAAPASASGHNAVSTSAGLSSSPGQSLSSLTTPPSPASPLSLLTRPEACNPTSVREAECEPIGHPLLAAARANNTSCMSAWPAISESPLWPQWPAGGLSEVDSAAPSKPQQRDEGALSAQLSNLKTQMAAVEAQGESLRAATRAVEEEYRRMVTASSWPGAGTDALGRSTSAIAAVPPAMTDVSQSRIIREQAPMNDWHS